MKEKIWDKVGICASGLCLIHCLATPVLLILFPAVKISFLDHEIIHEVFAVIVVTSILFAVYPHCKKHGHKDIIAAALLGVSLILASILTHEFSEVLGQTLTVFGSISLLYAHIKNMKVRHGKCESDVNTNCSRDH